MVLTSSLRGTVLALGMVASTLVAPVAVMAQEFADTHLSAAREAIAVLGATDQFDGILLQASDALKKELIQKNPDLQDVIIGTVDETAIGLVSRRTDLENEAARLYATAFSEEHLKEIAAFYKTDAGKNLIKEGPIVTRQLIRAAQIWQQGIARDLAVNAGAELERLTATAAEEKPAEDAPKAE